MLSLLSSIVLSFLRDLIDVCFLVSFILASSAFLLSVGLVAGVLLFYFGAGSLGAVVVLLFYFGAGSLGAVVVLLFYFGAGSLGAVVVLLFFFGAVSLG